MVTWCGGTLQLRFGVQLCSCHVKDLSVIWFICVSINTAYSAIWLSVSLQYVFGIRNYLVLKVSRHSL